MGSATSKTPSLPAWRDGEKRSVDVAVAVDSADGDHTVSAVEEAPGDGRLVAAAVALEADDDDGWLG